MLCVCCPAGVCVSGGEQGLVKTFTDRQMMASWQVLEAVSEAVRQAVRCIGEAVSKAKRCWGFFSAENNGRTAMVQGDILPLE